MGIKSAVSLCALALLVAMPLGAQDEPDSDDPQQDEPDDGSENPDNDEGSDDDKDKGSEEAPGPSPKAPTKATPKKDAKKDADKPKKPGDCVDVTTRARFASVGYDHIVILKSDCKKVMVCKVSTNVNPEVATVELPPGAEESVVTWRGSPARVFTPDVDCK